MLATKGLSSLLSLSFYKMFTYPIAYLLVFVLVSTAVLQIKFLNKSLQRFDSTVGCDQLVPWDEMETFLNPHDSHAILGLFTNNFCVCI